MKVREGLRGLGRVWVVGYYGEEGVKMGEDGFWNDGEDRDGYLDKNENGVGWGNMVS